MKLNRLFTILLLCAGLVLAGAPAFSCCAGSTPAHHCCPDGTDPTSTPSTGIETGSVVYGCCASEARAVLATTAMAVARQPDFDSTRADPPLSVSFLAALIAVHLPSALSDASTTPLFIASQSPLYLRTGRLRL
jgi:hypothetical protein